MKNSLFKKVFTLMAALALVVGTMTGFAGAKTEEVKADGTATVQVYYAFEDLRSADSVYRRTGTPSSLTNTEVIFVPASIGINFSENPCLPTIPKGSARQIVLTETTPHSTTSTTLTHFSKEKDPKDQSHYIYYKDISDKTEAELSKACEIEIKSSYKHATGSTTIAYVVTVEKGDGFDSCSSGCYDVYNTSNTDDLKYIYYCCDQGGKKERQVPGNVVLFKTKDVPVTSINAMVKATKEIPEDTVVTLTKDDIQLSVTIDGENYMVPSNLSDEDFKIDPSDKTVYITSNKAQLDNEITVLFKGNPVKVKVHAHEWTYKLSDDETTLTAKCAVKGETCPVEGTPQIKLVVRTGENSTDKYTEGDNAGQVKPCVEYQMNTAWNYVSGGAPIIEYFSLDTDEKLAGSPTRKGNYRATLTARGKDGVDYILAREFSISEEGTIKEVEGHVHQWKYTVDDNGVIHAECVAKFGDCPYKNNQYQIEGDVIDDEDVDPSSDDYVQIDKIKIGDPKGNTEPEADVDIPDPEIKYYRINDGGTETEIGATRPTTKGKYRVKITYENPDGTKVTGWTDFEITEDDKGDKHLNKEYRYVYSGLGLDRSKGYILYANSQNTGDDANTASKYNFVKFVDDAEIGYDETHAALRNYAHNIDGTVKNDMYIDMYNQKLVAPAGYTVAAYKTTKNGSWTAVKSGKTFDDILPTLLAKGTTTLCITDTYAAKEKKAGTYYYFSRTNAPRKVESVRACYDRCADELGVTNGQFIFMTTGVKKDVMYNMGVNYDITFGPQNSKNIISWGWGVWPTTGGVWVPDAGTKTSGGKTVEQPLKYNFYIRTKADVTTKADGTKVYYPASKEKKVVVASVGKAPTIKVGYNKKVNGVAGHDELVVKKGANAFFLGELTEIPDPMKVESEINAVTEASVGGNMAYAAFQGKTFGNAKSVVKVDVTNYITEERNKILVWTLATATKPASAKQTIELAKRKSISATSLKVDNGKVAMKEGEGKTALQYEIYDSAKNKWVTSIPASKVATEAAFEIRYKSNAKGGAETNDSTATGISSQLIVTYSNTSTDPKRAKIAITSATIQAMPNND